MTDSRKIFKNLKKKISLWPLCIYQAKKNHENDETFLKQNHFEILFVKSTINGFYVIWILLHSDHKPANIFEWKRKFADTYDINKLLNDFVHFIDNQLTSPWSCRNILFFSLIMWIKQSHDFFSNFDDVRISELSDFNLLKNSNWKIPRY